ncbi:hypothetical protein FRB97_002204 [Tulasnella sp. 331]|nr:hypothetical protein FRB97_002204 [Tulasnella sp. 331]
MSYSQLLPPNDGSASIYLDGLVESLLSRIQVDAKARLTSSATQTEKLELETLESYATGLNERIRKSIISLRRRCNSRLPIGRLPTELLVRIIFLAVQGLEKKYFLRLWELAHVSKLWCDLVQHSPILWGYLRSDQTASEVSTALRRSKGALIDVIYNDYDLRRIKGSFLGVVLEEKARWRSIEFLTDSADVFERLNDSTFHCLEDVNLVNGMPSNDPPFLTNLFGGRPPRLRYLTLSNILVPWDSDIFSRLERLSLSVEFSNGPEKGPSVGQVVEMLRASPELASLSLASLEKSETPPNSALAFPKVILPRLRFLGLDLQTWKAETLMACMTTPACTRFYLGFNSIYSLKPLSEGRNDRKTALLSTMASATTACLSIFSETAVWKWRTKNSGAADDGSWPFEASIGWFSFHHMPDIIMRLRQLLPRHIAFPIHLIIRHGRSLDTNAIVPLLSALPSIISLEMKNGNSRNLLLPLSSPQLSEDGHRDWLSPQLRSLKLSLPVQNRADLLVMVEARHGFGTAAEEEQLLPTKLETVTIDNSSWGVEDLRYLKESAPEVEWTHDSIKSILDELLPLLTDLQDTLNHVAVRAASIKESWDALGLDESDVSIHSDVSSQEDMELIEADQGGSGGLGENPTSNIILDMPPEILLEIILWASTEDINMAWSMGQVNQSIRRLILSSSTFWTRLDVNFPLRRNEIYLERSRDARIMVYASLAPLRQMNPGIERIAHFVDLVTRHSSRIQDLHMVYVMREWLEAALPLLKSAQNLHYLDIGLHNDTDERRPDSSRDEIPCKPRILRLRGPPVWNITDEFLSEVEHFEYIERYFSR